MYVLPPEQAYIQSQAHQLHLNYTLKQHNQATKTCQEKATLLGWELDRIIKALYYSCGASLVGIIARATTLIKPADIISETLQISKRQAKHYTLSPTRLAQGMTIGTSSPFLYSTDTTVDKLIICDDGCDEQPVDIAIGGQRQEDFYRSIWMRFAAMQTIVREQFPEKTTIYSN